MSCSLVLKQHGLKLTPQRKLIMDIIHKAGGHLTAEEIIDVVQTRMPGVNKSTIYRTLELLESLGCVFKSEMDGKVIFHHAEKGHHHHIVCRDCGATIDCEDDLFSSVETALRRKYGFQSELKHIVITGTCKDCNKKR